MSSVFKPVDKTKKKLNFKLFLYPGIIILMILNLFKSWSSLQERLNIIKNTENKIALETDKQDSLKRELAQAESPDFIESQARDKLNMVREGEIVILMPTISISAEQTAPISELSPNWQKWLKLFW